MFFKFIKMTGEEKFPVRHVSVDVDIYLFEKASRSLLQYLIRKKEPFMVWADRAIPETSYSNKENVFIIDKKMRYENNTSGDKRPIAVVTFSENISDHDRLIYMQNLIAFSQ